MTVSDRLGRVVGALHEIARTLESAEAFEPRILRALELLRDVVPCDRCAFFEASTNGKHDLIVTPVPSGAESARLDAKLKGLFRLITEDEEPAEGESSVVAPTTVHAHLALPVIGMDQTIGVLFIEADSDDPFGEESLRLLSLVAAQLGSYLVTLRALQKEARTADALASCAERCARVIADLIDVMRARAIGGVTLQRRQMNLSDVIVRVVEEYRLSHPDRAIHFEDSTEPLAGQWDADRLSQLFSNLLGHAVTHSPGGTEVRVRARRQGNEVQVAVHDEGPAIADDLLPTIFVKQIVDALDGTVTVQSTNQDGTMFTVILPFAS